MEKCQKPINFGGQGSPRICSKSKINSQGWSRNWAFVGSEATVPQQWAVGKL